MVSMFPPVKSEDSISKRLHRSFSKKQWSS
jgi:hypothetical protein